MKLASAAITVASATKERNPGLVRIAASLLYEARNGSRLRGRITGQPHPTGRHRRELAFWDIQAGEAHDVQPDHPMGRCGGDDLRGLDPHHHLRREPAAHGRRT